MDRNINLAPVSGSNILYAIISQTGTLPFCSVMSFVVREPGSVVNYDLSSGLLASNSIKPNSALPPPRLPDYLNDLKFWFSSKFLKLNSNKPELPLIGSKSEPLPVPSDPLCLFTLLSFPPDSPLWAAEPPAALLLFTTGHSQHRAHLCFQSQT